MAIKKKPAKKAVKKPVGKKKPAKKAVKKPVGKKKPAKKAVKKPVGKKKPAKKAVKKKAPAKVKKTSLLDRIASHREEFEKAKSKAEKSGEKLFKQAIKEIFSNFPELKSFSWDQYTPHWNDGDLCEFRCHISSLKTVNEDGTENEDDVWGLEHLSKLFSGDIEKKKKEILKQISEAKETWEKNSLASNLKDLNETSPEEMDKIHDTYVLKKAIVDLLEGIDESVYEKMFGEGTINVTRDDITVSECEHD